MSIDLHIHSVYSDGTYTPDEIIRQAKKKGLELVALTDHNNLDGVNDLRKASEEYGQNVVMGIEISTVYHNEEVHCLGYFNINSDFTSPKFSKLMEIAKTHKNSKKEQLKKMIENIAKDYNTISYKEFMDFCSSMKSNDNFNRVHVANYLMYKGLTNSVNDGFDKFINESSKYYVKKEQIQLLDAIKIILDAGGLPSIAHFVQYNFKYNEIVDLVEEIIKITDVIGIEAYHSDQDEAYTNQLMNFCYTYFMSIYKDKNVRLFYTIGSDCHGANKSVEIGQTSNGTLSIFAKDVREYCAKNTIKVFGEYGLI